MDRDGARLIQRLIQAAEPKADLSEKKPSRE